jgi:hypothetical protein
VPDVSRKTKRGIADTSAAAGDEPAVASAVVSEPNPKDRGAVLDARERAEKVIVRRDDLVNEAVGSEFYLLNGSWGDWQFPSGRRFAVTRYYRPVRIAVDFPVNETDQALSEFKRQALRSLGIAYVCVPLGKSLSIEQIRDAVASERELMASAEKGA